MSRYQPEQQQAKYPGLGFLFLILYIAAIYIRPQEWTEQLDGMPIVRITLIVTFIIFLLTYSPKRSSPQLILMLLLCLVIPLSGLRNGWLGGGVYQAQMWIIHSLLPFLVVSGIVVTYKRHVMMIWISMIAAVLMVHHGYAQISSVDGIGWTGRVLSQGTRITYTGIFNDPNDLGMFLLMNIPLTYLLLKNRQNKLAKSLFLLVIALLVYGIFLTNSRGTLVGLLAYITSYVWLRFGLKRAIWLVILLVPAAMFALGSFRAIDASEESAYGRVEAWYDGFQMFKYHPLVGVGKANFLEHHYRTAHNSYVLILAELGLIGYMLWSMAIMVTAWMAYKIMKLGKDQKLIETIPNLKQEAILAESLLFCLICYCTTAFFLSRSYIIILYIFMGLIVSQYQRVNQMTENNLHYPANFMGILAGLSILSIIGLYVVMRVLL